MLLEAQTLDVISVNLWQILISLANLVILYLLLKKFLFKPVHKFLAARKEEVENLYGEAEEAKEQAQHDKTVYEDKLAAADSEAREVVRSAMAKANEMSDEILADTGREVARMKARAEADIAQERKRAANALKDDVADLSMEIAEKVIGREIGEDDHRALIDDCIKELQ